jgi:hypothetical protein
MRAAALLLLSLATPHAAQEAVPQQVRAEFRIFSGTDEITASTRLRIMPTGTRARPTTVAEGAPLVVEVTPGIYDVQALLVQQGSIVSIRWAERLVLMYYPDEQGRHLEVINFQSGFGALQLRGTQRRLDAYDVAIFPAGGRSKPAGSPVDGDEYTLFVIPAGRYDVRIRASGRASDAEAARWLLDIEVPADRTRMKEIR